MGQYSVNGPDKLVLTKADVCACLHVSDSTLDRMVAAGDFPHGTKMTAQTEPVWPADVIAAWLRIKPLMFADEPKAQKKPPEEKSS